MDLNEYIVKKFHTIAMQTKIQFCAAEKQNKKKKTHTQKNATWRKMSSTSKKAKEATKARKGGANRIVVTPACESHGTAVESTAAPHKQDSASVDDELVLSQIAKASKSTNVHAADRVSNLGAPRERQEFTELRAVASAPHTVRIVVCVPRSWRVVQHEEKTEKTEKTEKNEKEKPDSRVDDGDDDDDAFVDATTMLLLPTDTINDVIAALSDALPLVTRVRLALADGVALDPSLQIGALTTRLSSASSSSITLSPFVPTRLFAKRAVYDIGSVIAHIDRFVTVVDVASFRTPEFDEQAPAISEFIVPRDVLAVPLAASIAAANEIPDSHYDVLGVVDKAVAPRSPIFTPPFSPALQSTPVCAR
jgi:hypothetical protein